MLGHRWSWPREGQRLAMISMHTSPLAQPGSGDAGGMNVYVDATARRLAADGMCVDVYTRSSSAAPAEVVVAPGYRVVSLPVGPPGMQVAKEDLPGHLCDFTAALLAHAAERNRAYDVVHSHYWLSGQVGMVAAARWGVPLVHTMHTIGAVKNFDLAEARGPGGGEPAARVVGEQQIVRRADRLVANTEAEAAALVEFCGADPDLIDIVHPGVDLEVFAPGDRAAARAASGLQQDAQVLLFVGRIQHLKGPDVAVRALAQLVAAQPRRRERLQLVVSGGPSGDAAAGSALDDLVARAGVSDLVQVRRPVSRAGLADLFRAADATLMPSRSESFGLVAVESQACGTPVLAAAVGGLPTAVSDGRSGLLVAGHDPAIWAQRIAAVLDDEPRRRRLSLGAVRHASGFGWQRTATGLRSSYATARRGRAGVQLLAAPA